MCLCVHSSPFRLVFLLFQHSPIHLWLLLRGMKLGFATLLLYIPPSKCPKIDVLAFTAPLARQQLLITRKINATSFSYSPVKDVLCFIRVGMIQLLIKGLPHLSDALFKSFNIFQLTYSRFCPTAACSVVQRLYFKR